MRKKRKRKKKKKKRKTKKKGMVIKKIRKIRTASLSEGQCNAPELPHLT